MVNNHGHPKSPKDRVGLDPFQTAKQISNPPRSAEFDERLGLVGLVFLVDGFEDSKTNLS